MSTDTATLYTDNHMLDLPHLVWKDPNPEWRNAAVCRAHPEETDDFFNGKRSAKKIKEYCSQCPVTQQCWTYAVNNGIMHGVWGGRTQHELQAAVRLRGSQG